MSLAKHDCTRNRGNMHSEKCYAHRGFISGEGCLIPPLAISFPVYNMGLPPGFVLLSLEISY